MYRLSLKARIVLLIVMLFFVSLVESCQELRYMIFAKTITANLADVHIDKNTDKYGDTHLQKVVGYSFMDGDAYRREYANVDMNWPGENNPTVQIQYIPGKERQSRLLGQTNKIWVIIFFASLVAGGIGLYLLSREK